MANTSAVTPAERTGSAVARAAKALRRFSFRSPLHLAVIALAVLWSIPTIALLISSFRDPADV
ncbi:MAG TPA: carbohydrate ABC transporter permease, partial [Dehalococcoidia bacterium]|nr:carbohydrate ABC transporter permease [Dehalococcoidia bacterium]